MISAAPKTTVKQNTSYAKEEPREKTPGVGRINCWRTIPPPNPSPATKAAYISRRQPPRIPLSLRKILPRIPWVGGPCKGGVGEGSVNGSMSNNHLEERSLPRVAF